MTASYCVVTNGFLNFRNRLEVEVREEVEGDGDHASAGNEVQRCKVFFDVGPFNVTIPLNLLQQTLNNQKAIGNGGAASEPASDR